MSVNLSVSGRVPRARWLLPGLSLIACACLLAAVAMGSVHEPWPNLFKAAWNLVDGHDDTLATMILQLRLVRAQGAFVTGASLALAGLLMQALLGNPLADPYVLGVSGGAAVAALLAMLFATAAWQLCGAAFLGALAISMLLYLLARRDLASGTTTPLLLTGVILASGCGALITLILSVAPGDNLRGMVFWMIGDLSGATWQFGPWVVLLLVGGAALTQARAINLLAFHGENALTLGVNVGRLRKGLFVGTALLTASAVSSAGSIGFVGLIVPHACRFAFGHDHRAGIPATLLVGGSFLMLADTIVRTVVAPQQLPVGTITALIGVPAFLFQLHHVRRSR